MWPTLNRICGTCYFRICLWPNDNQPEMYSTVNLVKLATDKTLDFYYTVITNDINERIFLFLWLPVLLSLLQVLLYISLFPKREGEGRKEEEETLGWNYVNSSELFSYQKLGNHLVYFSTAPTQMTHNH